jgi:hypothetical protein
MEASGMALEPTVLNAVRMYDAFNTCETDGLPVCGLCGGPIEMKDEHAGSCLDCGTLHGDALAPGWLLPIF